MDFVAVLDQVIALLRRSVEHAVFQPLADWCLY